MASRRSKPASLRLLQSGLLVRDHFGKEDLKSGKDVTPGQSSSVGVPRRLRIDVSVGSKERKLQLHTGRS